MCSEFWLTLEYVLTGSSDAIGAIQQWRQSFFFLATDPSTLPQYIDYISENKNSKFEGMGLISFHFWWIILSQKKNVGAVWNLTVK